MTIEARLVPNPGTPLPDSVRWPLILAAALIQHMAVGTTNRGPWMQRLLTWLEEASIAARTEEVDPDLAAKIYDGTMIVLMLISDWPEEASDYLSRLRSLIKEVIAEPSTEAMGGSLAGEDTGLVVEMPT